MPPWLSFVFVGFALLLVLAVVLSGGKFSCLGLKAEVPALGSGLSKLKKALRMNGNGRAKPKPRTKRWPTGDLD